MSFSLVNLLVLISPIRPKFPFFSSSRFLPSWYSIKLTLTYTGNTSRHVKLIDDLIDLIKGGFQNQFLVFHLYASPMKNNLLSPKPYVEVEIAGKRCTASTFISTIQLIFTFSKSKIEILENGVKYVQN